MDYNEWAYLMIKGITEEAKKALNSLFEEEAMKNPVISLMQGELADSGELINGIGIYANEDMSGYELVEIDGIKILDEKMRFDAEDKYLDIDKKGNFYFK